ncbi:cytochrome c oxidase assembly protein [Paludibacterium paludis]|uniref:Cytochrome c oxidase assembly protein CtaG n=1 Tax=Paludibacterium paludis TaxID=1225769 RepID=A0A918P2C1_9NEIS|nr:cytochrome c oxidase assembly protein [Paludibacterium paludis]GGY15500.1 cytochrome c oxidase assembly protein [Paludibacterium paludis]
MKTAPQANRTLLIKLAVIATGMFGFAYALIPLYRAFCDATELNQVVRRDRIGPDGEAGLPPPAEVRMVFDATVQPGLPWVVRPVTRQLTARTGEFVKVEYDITNASQREVVGQAIPRYLPAAAGEYVKKLDCFCFRQQRFKPGETRRFPVVFVIDRTLPASVGEITLAYTVFDVPGSGQ